LVIALLKVPVLDQFNHPLSPIYVGASVYEKVLPNGTGFHTIKQTIQAGNGGVYYLDPVGQVEARRNQAGLLVLPSNIVNPTTNAAAVNEWNATMTGEPLLLNFNATQKFDITVGGIKLDHGVLGRKVTVKKQGPDVRVIIDWPNS
jgi:hypothetical protein